jgi:hypothetical protein
MYLINNLSDHDVWWSNAHGWTGLDEADRYTIEDQRTLHLPVDGCWVPAWSVDAIQFARFIAEYEATGGFDQDALIDTSFAMDLELEQVEAIIERAQNVWDEEKEKIP